MRPSLFAACIGQFLATSPASACSIERAIYRDRDQVASIEFAPRSEAAAVTNSFTMLLPNNPPLEGYVLWSESVERPNGIVTRDCPEGDVTGDEIAACTFWQGVIYASDETGMIDLLPAEGAPAPKRLIFADLAYAMQTAPGWAATGLQNPPWDVFELAGCAE